MGWVIWSKDIAKGIPGPCALCGEPMVPGQKFYLEPDNRPAHAVCVWTREENRKESKDA